MVDFGTECHTAFLDHCLKLVTIDPNEMGHRKVNAGRRAEIIGYIDDVLDVFNEWRAVQPWDFPTPADIPKDVHLSLGTE